jgi:putative hydrolase of the HAD superfamily
VKFAPSVIFDIGGVVLEWNPSKVLADCYPDPAARATAREALLRHDDWQAFDRGELSEAELVSRAHARSGRSVGEFERLLAALWHSLTVKSDTVALLRSLQSRRVPLYCLSNMPAPVYGRLRQIHDFWDVFQGIVISGEVGLAKPSREVFELVLARYNLTASEAIFFDDVPENVAAARSVGIDGVVFRDADQCRGVLAERWGLDRKSEWSEVP